MVSIEVQPSQKIDDVDQENRLILHIIELMDEMISDRATVYVALLDEHVEVWRPVQAEHVEGDLYRLTGERPDDQVWPFSPGDVVRCQMRALSGDSARLEPVLVAYEKPT